MLNRGARAGRTLRVQKVVKPCPTCKADIADFLANSQVNRCCSLFRPSCVTQTL